MIGELREAAANLGGWGTSQTNAPAASPATSGPERVPAFGTSQTNAAPAIVEAKQCPACAARNPGPEGGTCRVCGSPLRRAGVVVATLAPGDSFPDGDPMAAAAADPPGPLSEGIVSFARKAWSERLHPRVHGGQGAGEFARGGGGAATAASVPVATSRRPHLEQPGSAARPKVSAMGRVPSAPKGGQLAGEARKLTEKELPTAVGLGQWSQKVAETVGALRAGTAKDTESVHRQPASGGGPGAYSPERVALHARIAHLLLQGAQAHANPEALFMAGGGGAGKSSLIKAGLARPHKDAVDVNPDIVKTMLPEYQALVAAGDQRAAALVHEESSHITKMVTNLAIMRRHHLTVDSTGDGEPGKFAEKIERVRGAGYKPRVVYATLPTDMGVQRAQERAGRSGRVVPEAALRTAHADSSRAYIEDVSKMGVPVDIYDTSGKRGSTPKLVAQHSGPDAALTVHNRALYQAFLEKADPSIAEGRRKVAAQAEAIAALRREHAPHPESRVVLGGRPAR